MSSTQADGLEMGDVQRLQDLVDRDALAEVCRSFYELFGLPIRVIGSDGNLLADIHQQRAICSFVNGFDEGRAACTATVNEVRSLQPEDGEVVHPCFTGAVYRVVPIRYDGRSLGRFVVGPYLPSETREMPRSLLRIAPDLDRERALEDLNEMPRVKQVTAERISQHLSRVLDLILFSGHRAYLASHMHLASVRSSFRELAQKNAKLQAAYDELTELDRLKSNFLATVSHELRTPLTSIIGYSEMLASGIAGELNEEQTSFVETIRNKGDQLLELISSLLDLARFEQGKVALRLQPVDASPLARDVIDTVQPAAKKKGVRVHCHVEPGLPLVNVDPARLRQALQNLIDNAIKFTPAGGDVTLRAYSTMVKGGGDDDDDGGAVLMMAEQPAVEFCVQDTGPGIPLDEQARVFDAFYQVDGSVTREHGGTGLGLSIVQRLVEAHGGTVSVQSEPGAGAAFRITLPESSPGD